jgi:DNA-binding response OmpR family regulator
MDLLIIEDDRLLSETIRRSWPIAADKLRFVHGYRQSLPIIQSAEIEFFDGVILDVNLPDGNGLTILRTIREAGNIPVILISGLGSAESRADAMDLGADDYVMKPFSVRELQARIKRQVESRVGPVAPDPPDTTSIGTVSCDLKMRRLSVGDREISLTDAEVRILATLVKSLDRVCSKTTLYKNALFRDHSPEDKTLDVYISRIRKKLGELDPASADMLQTVRGSGYRLIS